MFSLCLFFFGLLSGEIKVNQVGHNDVAINFSANRRKFCGCQADVGTLINQTDVENHCDMLLLEENTQFVTPRYRHTNRGSVFQSYVWASVYTVLFAQQKWDHSWVPGVTAPQDEGEMNTWVTRTAGCSDFEREREFVGFFSIRLMWKSACSESKAWKQIRRGRDVTCKRSWERGGGRCCPVAFLSALFESPWGWKHAVETKDNLTTLSLCLALFFLFPPSFHFSFIPPLLLSRSCRTPKKTLLALKQPASANKRRPEHPHLIMFFVIFILNVSLPCLWNVLYTGLLITLMLNVFPLSSYLHAGSLWVRLECAFFHNSNNVAIYWKHTDKAASFLPQSFCGLEKVEVKLGVPWLPPGGTINSSAGMEEMGLMWFIYIM